jgi:hypothetical protein
MTPRKYFDINMATQAIKEMNSGVSTKKIPVN